MLAAPWVHVVGERGIGAHEDVVFERDSVPQLHAGLDRDSVAHADIALDEDAVTYIAVLTDDRSLQDVSEGPNPGPVAHGCRLAEGLRMYEGVHALIVPYCRSSV